MEHGFFSRRGGVSDGLYGSLNVGYGSRDDPRRVAANRRRCLVSLGAREATPLVTVRQVHGRGVAVVEEPWPRQESPEADGLVTRRRDVALAVVTADCAPVLLADPDAGVIAAAHAGWRGALAGIVEATVQAMVELGASPGAIVAAVGPTVGQPSYEVGPELPATFLAADPSSPSFFAPRGDRFVFDLKGYVASRLRRAGVEKTRVGSWDTYRDEELFFSYRRSCHRKEPDFGRQLSAILLVPDPLRPGG